MNTIYLLYITFGLIVLLAIWLLMIEVRLKKIFRGKRAKDLEKVLSELGEDFKKLNLSQEKTENYLKEAEIRLQKSLKRVGFLRFNPFGESGSNQSFSIALLDEIGNGAVISALYTRDNVKVYAKPINNYKSEHPLTPEEEKAIAQTKGL